MRANARRFAVAPGAAHVFPEVEDVVVETERYWIVEKRGPAGEEAVALDPRAA